MNFHLAIPSLDLQATKDFYLQIGGKMGREYESHVVMRFFNCQLVAHKCDKSFIFPPKMYPRHFGMILFRYEELELVYSDVKLRGLEFFEDMFMRHEGKFEEHKTFFLKDPSNNVIEFKAYKNLEAIFG